MINRDKSLGWGIVPSQALHGNPFRFWLSRGRISKCRDSGFFRFRPSFLGGRCAESIPMILESGRRLQHSRKERR